MKIIQKVAEQGELRIRRVEALPADVVEQKSQNGRHIVGHSETGHHHTVADKCAKFFEGEDPLTCYLQVTGEYSDLVHERSFDTHETLRFGTGIWKVRRQREYIAEGWRRALD